MKWVTWEKVGVDRMACAWLIRKWIDSDAEFLFVPVGQKPLPEGAEPFDIPGVRLTHRRGHCTFHTMLREFKIEDPILERIARIVDEADTVQEVILEPVAPGLDYICDGIRLTSPDDLTALERGSLIFEAVYAQLSAEQNE
ncbi:chromate resistance protein ChrB domain-containing protein [Ammoniphilus sp. 3BR4]|uniref:chromate resistance protein ChrB domain-containing protein n=1 Tax=Ammoniphilus sp. 3BR4 TaxID=3158265 RepID=UPI003467E339